MILLFTVSGEQSEDILQRLKSRMIEYGLELHPDKTKIVYCRNYFRKEEYDRTVLFFWATVFNREPLRACMAKRDVLSFLVQQSVNWPKTVFERS